MVNPIKSLRQIVIDQHSIIVDFFYDNAKKMKSGQPSS